MTRWPFLMLVVLSACHASSGQPEMVVVQNVEERPTLPTKPGCIPVFQEVYVMRGQEPVCKLGKLERVSVVYTYKFSALLRVDCGCVTTP